MYNSIKRINCRLVIVSVIVGSLSIISCDKRKNSKPNGLSLNPRYLEIKDINSLAKCKGPKGNYTTKVISKKDGSILFTQIYSYQNAAPFIAEINADAKGIVLDENSMVVDTLSELAIEMIRGHDFHRMQTNPEVFYGRIKFKERLTANMELYAAVDRLQNPVKIYYNTNIKQIERVAFRNMMDSTEVIEIVFKKWIDSDFGKLAKEIEIIQGKKDTFHFHFETVKIN